MLQGQSHSREPHPSPRAHKRATRASSLQFAKAYHQLRDSESAELACIFAQLLKDKETEVRLTAVKEIEAVAWGCGAVTFSECVLDSFETVFEVRSNVVRARVHGAD